MALQAKVIKAKINSVKNIRKITRAMEMVAANKMRKATKMAEESKPYICIAKELLDNISDISDISHDLLSVQERAKKTLIITISSNKGLCGGYNASIRRAVSDFVVKNKGEYSFITIGKYSQRFAKKLDGDLIASFTDIGDTIEEEDIWSVNSLIINEFRTGQYKNVILFYTQFNSPVSYTTVQRDLLPIKKEVIDSVARKMHIESEVKSGTNFASFVYEPGIEEVLDFLLPRVTEIIFYQGILESLASEHSSRMIAMKNATDNAGTLIDELNVGYNRARQAAITQEIAEIAGGTHI